MKELNVQLDNLCQVRRRACAASPSTHRSHLLRRCPHHALDEAFLTAANRKTPKGPGRSVCLFAHRLCTAHSEPATLRLSTHAVAAPAAGHAVAMCSPWQARHQRPPSCSLRCAAVRRAAVPAAGQGGQLRAAAAGRAAGGNRARGRRRRAACAAHGPDRVARRASRARAGARARAPSLAHVSGPNNKGRTSAVAHACVVKKEPAL